MDPWTPFMMITCQENRFLCFLGPYARIRVGLVITLKEIPPRGVIIHGLEIDAIFRRELLFELDGECPLFKIIIRALPIVGAIGPF